MNLNSLPQVCPAGICGALKTLSPSPAPSLSLSLSLCTPFHECRAEINGKQHGMGVVTTSKAPLPFKPASVFRWLLDCPFAQGTGRKSYWKDGKCLPKLLSMSMCMGVHVLSRFINWVNTN